MYKLSLFETQKAIKYIKDNFQKLLSDALNLQRISGPIILSQNKGMNDDLNGVESPVRFESNVNGLKGEVPQSLMKKICIKKIWCSSSWRDLCRHECN